MKTEVLYISLLTVLMVLFISTVATAGPTIVLQPSSDQIDLGSEFTLQVNIREVTSLFAASFEVQYDNTLLEFVDVSAGDFLGDDVVFFSIEGDGSVSIAITKKAGSDSVDGAGMLAEVKFKSIRAGAVTISVRTDTLTLQQPDGSAVPEFEASVEEGSIDVIESPITPPSISIDLSAEEISIGQQFPIQVKVTDVANLFGIAFELKFDETILKAVSAAPGDLLGDDVVDVVVSEDGSISVGISRKAGAGGVDGAGVIAVVTLEAIGNGETDISFNSETIELKGPDDVPIEGFSSLDISSVSIAVQKPALVARGKLLRTWGYIRRSWKER